MGPYRVGPLDLARGIARPPGKIRGYELRLILILLQHGNGRGWWPIYYWWRKGQFLTLVDSMWATKSRNLHALYFLSLPVRLMKVYKFRTTKATRHTRRHRRPSLRSDLRCKRLAKVGRGDITYIIELPETSKCPKCKFHYKVCRRICCTTTPRFAFRLWFSKYNFARGNNATSIKIFFYISFQ